MATGGKKICRRSGKTIFPADPCVGPITGIITGHRDHKEELWYLKAHFTCATTNCKLTLKTYIQQEGDCYLKGKEPGYAPNQVEDVIIQRVAVVPDANFDTNDRMFNIAGKQEFRGTTGEDQGSAYAIDAVGVQTQTTVPDSNMRTTDRKFNVAGKAEHRGADASVDPDQGSNYGPGGQVLETQQAVVRPPTFVNNVNMIERRYNGVGAGAGVGGGGQFTGVQDEAGN